MNQAKRHSVCNVITCMLKSSQAIRLEGSGGEDKRWISQQCALCRWHCAVNQRSLVLATNYWALQPTNCRWRAEDNVQKTKVTFNSLAREQEFVIGSEPLKFVLDYVYLGQLKQRILIKRNKFTEEINCGTAHTANITKSWPLANRYPWTKKRAIGEFCRC